MMQHNKFWKLKTMYLDSKNADYTNFRWHLLLIVPLQSSSSSSETGENKSNKLSLMTLHCLHQKHWKRLSMKVHSTIGQLHVSNITIINTEQAYANSQAIIDMDCIIDILGGNPKKQNPESKSRSQKLENKIGKTKERNFFKSEILCCIVCLR